MGFIEILLISISVAMDAFAVSICKGLSSKSGKIKTAFACGSWFSIFQMIMPLIGYFLGSTFSEYITSFDHWIVFILLGILGVNMIKEAISQKEEETPNDLKFKTMLILAIATSIDALAIGITLALVSVNIMLAILTIGICTFIFCFVGAFIGKKFGEKHKKIATIIGGIILIIMGIKILIEHLFF